MATGMAIMGFGGGAMIGSPLAVWLMGKFATATRRRRCGDLHHAGLHLFRLHDGRLAIVRVPAPGWKPAGLRRRRTASKLITKNDVFV